MTSGHTTSISIHYQQRKKLCSLGFGLTIVGVSEALDVVCSLWLTMLAISFLMRNSFNMEKPFTDGVHYLSRQEEVQVRKKLIEDEELRSRIPDMQLSDDDIPLIDHIHDSVKRWQALPKRDQEPYLNIPEEDAEDPIPSTLTRYQIRLTHQVVRNEYPNLKTQGMGQFVQITNPSSEQQINQQEIREQKREVEIANAVGFRWILEAIMGGDISKLPHYYVVAGHPPDESPKNVQAFLNKLQTKLKSQSRALVGHNCMTDVINLYRCFIGDLPETAREFNARLQGLFPMVIDTKYVASLGNKRWADTSLKSVESDLCSVPVPAIHLPPPVFDRYISASNYHEAGFDSFVTAKIGLKMPGKLKREHKDIRLLVENSAPNALQNSTKEGNEPKPDAAVPEQKSVADEKTSVAKSIVEVIANPVTAVQSILMGPPVPTAQEETMSHPKSPPPSLLPASIMPTNGALVKTIISNHQTQASPGGLQKLGTISKKSNIFDLLGDEEEIEVEEESKQTEDQRLAEMVQEGRLMPRWEQDAEFWKLISNKLQANATQEGILDLTKHQH